MSELVLYGPTLSTYGRICTMVAVECGLRFRTVPTAAGSEENLKRHPFGRTPSATIDGHTVYEAAAICSYLDLTYNEGRFQDGATLVQARNMQWLSVANSYVFPETENGLVLPRLVVPLMGGVAREDIVERAIPRVSYVMSVLSEALEHGKYFAGPRPMLCDLFLFPMIKAVDLTPEGKLILQKLAPLNRWLADFSERPSALETRWPIESDI